jgi:hypothetical protein
MLAMARGCRSIVVLLLFVMHEAHLLLEPAKRLGSPPPRSEIDVDSGSGKMVLVVLPIKVITTGVYESTPIRAIAADECWRIAERGDPDLDDP